MSVHYICVCKLMNGKYVFSASVFPTHGLVFVFVMAFCNVYLGVLNEPFATYGAPIQMTPAKFFKKSSFELPNVYNYLCIITALVHGILVR